MPRRKKKQQRMDADRRKRTTSCPSVASNKSKDEHLTFSRDIRTNMDADLGEHTSSCPSVTSDKSKDEPLNFSRNMTPTAAVQIIKDDGLQIKYEESDLELPPMIEDWTKDHVKAWLVSKLRVSKEVAQNLYDQELSGACLASLKKEDLLDLGVPRAPALQMLREIEKFRPHSDSLVSGVRTPQSEYELRKAQDVSDGMNEYMETATVSSDSGIQSLSSAVQMLQMPPCKINLEQDESSNYAHSMTEIPDTEMAVQPQKPFSQIRPFDRSNTSMFYMENDVLPPMAGPSNLIDPIREYVLLPNDNEASDREILYEFTKEVFSFAASCMNSRTNGTIHFGVHSLSDHGEIAQVVGQKIKSFRDYTQAFESSFGEFFEEQHVHTARMCIRVPQFIQVCHEDGTISDRCVIEVDVVPVYSQTLDNIFYTQLGITAAEKSQHCKTECLFIRDGQRSTNLLEDPNPRLTQEKLKSLTDKVKSWATARKSAEERYEVQLFQSHQGQRLKQLVTRGKDAFDSSLQVIVVTDKCHPSQLEFMDFLKEMKLFAVLDFDPESDVSGTCSFYRKDSVANLHFPNMYTAQDSISAILGKLNLFKQTSWIFCNGRLNEENEEDKPLTPSEWIKRRSGDISNMVTWLCNPDLISRDKLLVIFVLHSAVTEIYNPILETFCAMYRSLGGAENMLCLCRDSAVFKHWKDLVKTRCQEEISNKCIYELSLIEISSTIRKLKEPKTRSSQRYLPSTGSSSVLLAKKDEELMTVLDILCENECENTEIETNDSFQEFKKQTEEDFYRGGQVSWWNFYLSENDCSLPFIKRDKYIELYDLIMAVGAPTSRCSMINLFHHPGCGGTTLAKHVLWNLRRKFRCAVVKNNKATNNEVAAEVINLLTYGRQSQPGNTPVLLLVDNWDDVEDLKLCILSGARDKNQQSNLMAIILNCERTQFPEESSRKSRIPNVFIANKLSPQEQKLFSAKLQQLKKDHEKPDTFYAFMIMTNNFSETYIANVVSNTVKDLDATSPQGKLFSFLALLNTFVDGSYISLSLCEELVGIKNPLWKRETLEEKMGPYSSLLITFTVEEHGTYQAVRFLHQMIAQNCLKILKRDHNLSLSDMAMSILECDKVYKSCMGKDFLYQDIQSMLVRRHRKEHGGDKNTQFSPLIEKIREEEGSEHVRILLEKATERFDRSATLPQALARHFCLNEKQFDSALRWALDAQSKNSNSYIADTVGQVYKSQLKKYIEDSGSPTPEVLKECLIVGSKAVKAFQYSQELANRDEQMDQFDMNNMKRSKSYNTSGYVGEMEVMMILLDIIKGLPFYQNNKLEKDKMRQFLKGHLSAKDLHLDHSNTTTDQFIVVLTDHADFLVSFKKKLKEIFGFFDNYFTYLRQRSQEREAADERNKKKLSELFQKYVEIFSSSEEEKASEKARNPKLSLHQEVMDQMNYLEMKRVDSFAGLLQCLTEKSPSEMEFVLKKWKFVFDNSPSKSGTTLNFILANIVMHCIKPSSKLVKRYEELVDLLDKELQKEGTRSKLTEMYYLSMLLMWPAKDRKLESTPTYKDISTYITSAKRSFSKRFSHLIPARSAIAHFFLGKSSGLKRIVPKVKLDKILAQVNKKDSGSSQSSQPHNVHRLWQSGTAWNEPDVQKELLRVKGKSENGDIYINYGGNLKMSVRPAYLGDIRTGYSREDVSFYLGFTMEGPVAYNIKYENDT
ncbi:sterile alpha motif domain-containing protein 9 [Oryzias melastigma]|uniref:sterile alpha motif domain-containing protein 9 n=1 Tax=Oryzias melastigma TaxID=30732 RepID=UPI000CF7DE94|nr:sterile alpha motif domain-containing protein 9 [Oryzias melastigma]